MGFRGYSTAQQPQACYMRVEVMSLCDAEQAEVSYAPLSVDHCACGL